jgi:hypothetical protein
MRADPKPHRADAADRLHLTAAIALAAGAIAAGIALGQHSAAAHTAPVVARAGTVQAVGRPADEATADRSLPSAGEALRAAPSDPAEPPSTF